MLELCLFNALYIRERCASIQRGMEVSLFYPERKFNIENSFSYTEFGWKKRMFIQEKYYKVI